MSQQPTERINNKDINTADQRLALLALAGEQAGPAGPCPEAETLAALVEGRLTVGDADACLAHLAGCESCYALWLQLDREWQAQRRDTKQKSALLRLAGRPRALPVVGSLLAAAASIAVVLTLTTEADRARLPYPAKKAVSAQAQVQAPAGTAATDSAALQADLAEPAKPAEPAEPLPERKDRLSGRSSAGFSPLQAKAAQLPATVQERAKTGQAKAEAHDPEDLRKRDALELNKLAPPAKMAGGMAAKGREAQKQAATPPAAMASNRRATATSGQEREAPPLPTDARAPAELAAPAPQPMREQAPVTAGQWYDRIRQGCRNEPRANFTAIAAQGKQLLQKSAALSGRDRQRIERLVAELGKKEQAASGRCPALLQLLELPDPGPRR